jgi:CrcB protein
MSNLIYIGLGGFIGSVSRFLLAGMTQRLAGDAWFPLGTLVVNVLGCFVIGLLGGLVEHRDLLNAELRLFLLVGVLGGFTTFSTFGYETLTLLREAQFFAAVGSVFLHVVLGLAAVWMGYSLSMMK